MKIEPHCIEWTKTGWANTFHSTPPKDADIQTKLYTEAQLRQLGEACAQVAGPEDSYQDEWFNAKADAVNKINALIKELLG